MAKKVNLEWPSCASRDADLFSVVQMLRDGTSTQDDNDEARILQFPSKF